MKNILIFLLVQISFPVSGQIKFDTDSIFIPEDASNIYVHKIGGDSLSTTFLILIKEEVSMHKHDKHSETVVILEGTAQMILGDENMEVKKGDILFIPAGTWHQVIVTSRVSLKVISVQAPFFDGTDRILYRKN